MIEDLRIVSLGVIDEAELELGPGLNVLTGETGAGKTMVVSALGLLMGGRADPAVVRTGAARARVEALVGMGDLAAIEALGGDSDEGIVLLARHVAAAGRSRAFAGGAAVPAGVLADLTADLVAVHGQSDQHRLLRPDTQLAVLDRFGGAEVAALAEQFAQGYHQLRAVEADLRDVLTNARERAREADLLKHGLAEIAAVAPISGEAEHLAVEESRLGFSDALRDAAERARQSLSADDSSIDALTALGEARSALEAVRTHDAAAAGLADRTAELLYLANDLAVDIAAYAAGVETDPARLAQVSQRRADLSALTRKYGESIDDVLLWSQTAAERLLTLDSDDERIEHLRSQRHSLRAELAEVGERLSRSRAQAAQALADLVSVELTALAMPHARLRVAVTQREDPKGLQVAERTLGFGREGLDTVDFELAANAGTEFRPLAKGASGGELSRVMLAIEVVVAGSSPVPTMVFDEVDAGVGGKAAVEVGRRLAALARRTQVLVVTHLPQVAAYADRHLVVRKSDTGSVTSSDVSLLDHEGRVRELSRMLAGLEASETAVAHAAELIDVAHRAKAAMT